MERINYSKIIKEITHIVDSKKGEDVVVYDVRDMTSFTDYIMIVSVNSSAQMNAVLKELNKNIEIKPNHIEGDASGGWILMDYEGVVVNIFVPEIRNFYCLERLWGEAKIVNSR